MRRSALALLGLLALPAIAAAQDRPLLANEPPPERLPESRFAITPFIGVRLPSSSGDLLLLQEDGDLFRFDTERGGSTMIGLNAEVRLRGPWSLVVGGAYAGSQQDQITLIDEDDNTTAIETDGPAMWFAKAGVSVRLPDPVPDNRRFHPSAFITVAPSMVWLDHNEIDGAPDGVNRGSHHFALNIGADAVARFGRTSNWAFTLAFEDFITFWDTDALAVRDAAVGQVVTGEPVVIDYDFSSTNIFALRVGVSYRFR